MFENSVEYQTSYNDIYSILLYSLKIEKKLSAKEKNLIVDYLIHLNGEFSDIKTLLSKINRISWDAAEKEISIAIKNGVTLINILDPSYPANLKEIPDPPLVLFVRGDLTNNLIGQTNNSPILTIAMVGMRSASPKGKKIAQDIAEELTLHRVNIVSGLAYGIDTAAHLGAIKAVRLAKAEYGINLSPGIIVLGSGVLSIYPKQNIKLAEYLLELGGCIVSEYGIFTEPQSFFFPARNRIISGLSSAVVVVEAQEKSGSLITARLALEQGRDVFAIPGAIDNHSNAGTNKLIQQGAALITCVDDILANFSKLKFKNICTTEKALAPTKSNNLAAPDLNNIEFRILNFIKTQNNCGFDEIIETLQVETAIAISTLNRLEMGKEIFIHPGNIYSTEPFI
ncbi:MAG: DNA-processing protein DprA [Deltaproteobacteria bacterium]|jgi:DNA processing protein|nr:DNA-processing protein DprA [Deltaproteobacteria bacterium]